MYVHLIATWRDNKFRSKDYDDNALASMPFNIMVGECFRIMGLARVNVTEDGYQLKAFW